MGRSYFYNSSVKNIIVTFGTIFDEITVENDFGERFIVPIGYSPKEKFVEYYSAKSDFDEIDVEQTLPRMGFEMTGLNFAPERYHNPLSRMTHTNTNDFMYARIPYDFSFNLYIATKKFEESLKIVEQIVPYFTPELCVTIKDRPEFELATDIPVVLNSVGYDIQYEGSFEEKRTIEWTLQFTVKGYMYSDLKTSSRIKETVTDLKQEDIDRKFSQMIYEVDPRSANKPDPHVITKVKHDENELWRGE
jgi:hypothetical protein